MKWGTCLIVGETTAIHRLVALILAAAVALSGVLLVATTSLASDHFLPPFTQDELDNNWTADRQFPSGGVESVSAFGRDDVAQIGINSATNPTSASPFNRTEGIKKTDDHGTALQIDLYIDSDWEGTAMQAGFWVAGWDPTLPADGQGRHRTGDFAIIEFTTVDTLGWRIWSSGVGWTNRPDIEFEFDQWTTLRIELDAGSNEYSYFIDNELVATLSPNSGNPVAEFFGEVILNGYNYGHPDDDPAPLNPDDYQIHWHAGIDQPTTVEDCRDGGWEQYGFDDERQCVMFVQSGFDAREGRDQRQFQRPDRGEQFEEFQSEFRDSLLRFFEEFFRQPRR